ncbi:MAG: carboxypeptidase-like regulatory domain-containing protein, partial [Flavobacterium sp.]|uniref:carboxypeptidase-like regulatory domain-containing protein n=1 Tax=Flavobacterium sp. TaxID=239 RepID=UPI003264F410
MNKNSILKYWATIQLPKLYYILLLICCIGVQAQTTIKGIVSDANGSLPGVTIKVKDKPIAALSDKKGNYTVTVEQKDILIFSFIGYKTIQTPVANQTTINIKLEEDATALKEVIINAGYYSVKDKERTGSIAKITSKDIENQPVTNVLATMQGRMAGVNIVQTSGVPGGGFEIQIRGQ